MLRDVLLRQVPTVLRTELYAVPALVGAGVVAAARGAGSTSTVFPILGAAVCFGIRIAGLRFGVGIPIAPSERQDGRPRD